MQAFNGTTYPPLNISFNENDPSGSILQIIRDTQWGPGLLHAYKKGRVIGMLWLGFIMVGGVDLEDLGNGLGSSGNYV